MSDVTNYTAEESAELIAQMRAGTSVPQIPAPQLRPEKRSPAPQEVKHEGGCERPCSMIYLVLISTVVNVGTV